jgi:hypothetical protein
MITLDVGGLAIDGAKNSRGNDHGMLFQEQDRKRVHCDQVDYEYCEQHDEDPAPMELAFTRPLRDVVPRLELLGFTLDQARREYADRVEAWREEKFGEGEDATASEPNGMGFDEFCAFATEYPLLHLDDNYVSVSDAIGEEQIRGRFKDETVRNRIPLPVAYDDTAWSERSYFGTLINILHPYSVLRILALSEANLNADVVWQYGPLVDNGWADARAFVAGARRTQTFLVATEGSSDVHILKHAFALLRPEIADFFRFIDVSERHPFSGVGSLVKFAEGLAKIDVQNQMIFLFDNDAEGLDAFERVLGMKLPPNMHAMMLPELEQFRAFPARGPDGVNRADINRRAAAIECYLDLTLDGCSPAQVTWTNYKDGLGVYHGSLDCKERYTRKFLSQNASSVAAGSYDVSKLRVVLDALIRECSTMAMKAVTATVYD